MRKIMLLALVAGATALLGCAGVVKTPGDRENTYRQALNMDMRQIVDDWDKIWFADRPYRMTKYHTR